jgi:TRAP-type mannitol/chloroaromatic compound transport system permease small subunit
MENALPSAAGGASPRRGRGTQRLLHAVDQWSTWFGKAFAWIIVALTLLVSVEVFKRYILNAPTAWMFDANNFMYGTLFMMCGAYTLALGGHVRADFIYGRLRPRAQAWVDLSLYVLFLVRLIVVLV